MIHDQRKTFTRAGAELPFPIAAACYRFLDVPFGNLWQEWEGLSREVLEPTHP